MNKRPGSRGRPAEPVHDGEAKALLGHPLDEDALDSSRIELPEDREEVASIGFEVLRHGPHDEPRATDGEGTLGHQGHWPAGLEPRRNRRLPRSTIHEDDLGAWGIAPVAE